VFVTQSLDALQ